MSTAHAKSASSASRNTPVSKECFQRNASAVVVHMNRFFIQHLVNLYREFEGDLLQAIVLGEIGHHNVCHAYTCMYGPAWKAGMESHRPGFWEKLVPCNAFSLSAATGIPRETIRRKVALLVRKGWVARGPHGEFMILPAVSKRFIPEFNLNLLNAVLKLADELRTLLAGAPAPEETSVAAKPRRGKAGPRKALGPKNVR